MSFNAHIVCPDAAAVAATAALTLQRRLRWEVTPRVATQMGLAAGMVSAASCGYAHFKSMVTVGDAAKVAAVLAHLHAPERGVVFLDEALHSRIHFTFHTRVVDLLYLPTPAPAKSVRVYLLQGPKELEDGEWMYQLEGPARPAGPPDAPSWDAAFGQIVAAADLEAACASLEAYVRAHSADLYAARLERRLSNGLWKPQCGYPLNAVPPSPDPGSPVCSPRAYHSSCHCPGIVQVDDC